MFTKSLIAYHFVKDKLRDGRDVPEDGVKLVHNGKLKLCVSGLHASKHPFDALRHAPGNTICEVLCEGKIIHGKDKLVCTERTILQRTDATSLLHKFTRDCALGVVHLWDAHDAVVEFLKTGDERLRVAAYEFATRAFYINRGYHANANHASLAAFAASYITRSATSSAYSAAHAVAHADEITVEKYKEKFATLIETEFNSK